MSSKNQIPFSEVNLEKLVAEARVERAKIMRNFLAKFFRRQTLPAYHQPALRAS